MTDRNVCPTKIQYILLLVIALLTGCNSLPSGDLTTLNQPPAAARCGQVILLRGWRGLYSTGIDDLAGELRDEGLSATAYRETQWHDVTDALIAQRAQLSTAQDDPLVLIGFSYGADHVIDIARHLPPSVKVTLLITIDPVTPDDVPANVSTCLNLYRSNGWLDVFPFFRGVPLNTAPAKVTNINLKDHPELDDPGMGHTHIAGSAKVHQAVVNEVLKVCPLREPQRPTTRSLVN